MQRTSGQYEISTVAGEAVNAFVPLPLPPAAPPLDLALLQPALGRARHALTRLELAGQMVPSLDWYLYAFVRKEAVLSSQIEGTQATLVDLLSTEASDQTPPQADVEEVTNYLTALTWARTELTRPGGLPLCTRLLCETHRRLLQGTRGRDQQPGELRRSQNWVGGTRPGTATFVPPPPHRVADALSQLERYLHADDILPPLIQIGLAHVQLETIHPFLDGNGRLGRLLITLLLEHWDLLPQPLLYLSLFFKRHRPEYYRRLSAVRTDGDWEGWLGFFLEGIATIADESVVTARDLFALVSVDRQRLLAQATATVSSLRLLELLPQNPIVTLPTVASLLATTRPTASKAVTVLTDAKILVEVTGQRRDRRYHYARYIDLLTAGTQLNS